MKNKLLLISLLFAASNISFANTTSVSVPMDTSKLPQADTGVQVVPRSQLSETAEENKEAVRKLQEFKTHGYVNADSTEPRKLLAMKYKGLQEIKENKNNTNPSDTHLKSNISDIKLAFPFKGIPMQPNSEIIGYAAVGGWRNGWTGIKVFFTNRDLGTCSYTLDNMSLTHGAVHISADVARYDVNKMPNVLNVSGNINAGFMYDIGWYDKKFSKELECANMAYDKEITDKLISYARVIDKG